MSPTRVPVPSPFVPAEPAAHLTDLGRLRAGGVAAGIKPSGNPDVALLVFDEPLPVAGVFTKNAFAAAPVQVCREHLRASGGLARAVVVNAGNANACTGDRGLRDARAMCDRVAALVGCPTESVLVASTGVIGVPLPIERVLAGVDAAFGALTAEAAGAERFLAAIQTTDAFRKEAGARSGDLVTAGVAKGAGMIEPDMATMIAIAGTSARLTAEELAAAAPALARASFNAIHVDSHASTNDTFLIFSTGEGSGAREAALAALARVAERLAWLIARDGEGATKVTTVEVRGAPSDEAARDIARRVARSALVRTALYGNDPNWGRFVSALGNSPFVRDISRLSCRLGDVVVFDRGEPASFDRAAAVRALASSDDVRLVLDLNAGAGQDKVLTSDLGYKYIEINAEYTT